MSLQWLEVERSLLMKDHDSWRLASYLWPWHHVDLLKFNCWGLVGTLWAHSAWRSVTQALPGERPWAESSPPRVHDGVWNSLNKSVILILNASVKKQVVSWDMLYVPYTDKLKEIASLYLLVVKTFSQQLICWFKKKKKKGNSGLPDCPDRPQSYEVPRQLRNLLWRTNQNTE